MQKNFSKRIIAGLLASAMVIPGTVGTSKPLQASAYEVLGETTFDHKILPWHTAEASPAKQYFELSEGTVRILIQVPEGADKEKWDLQFRHRNLNFQKGHEYKVSFKAKSSRDGFELCSKIGNIKGDEEYFQLDGETNAMHMGPHMGGQWYMSAVKLSTEWQTFEGIFKPTSDLEAVEWCFQYAKGTQYQGNAQAGDEFWFDDMSIEDLTDDVSNPGTYIFGYTTRGYSGLWNNYISVNQLGYYQGLEKIATLGDNKGDIIHDMPTIELESNEHYVYEIVSTADDKVVYTGETSFAVKDYDSGDTVCKIDFTEFNETGEYYIRIKGKEWRSFPFRIGNDIYSDKENDLLTNALNYFYQNRGGIKIESKYITSGNKSKLAHNYDRDESVGFVQTSWQSCNFDSVKMAEQNSSSRIDTSGGWFSGANFDKSMKESGIALWTLQNLYERAALIEKSANKFADGSGTIVIPETGNKIPDILDECRYELDYMSKMKVQPDEETWGKYAGLYYNGIKGVEFEPLPKDYEHEFHSCYIVQPPTFAATLNYAACAAQGARLWEPYDKEYAAELLKSAKEAYRAYKEQFYWASPNEESNKVSLYEPSSVKRTGLSGDTYIEDDAYWAACELYITAKEMDDSDAESYLKDLSDYSDAFKVKPRNGINSDVAGEPSFTLFNSDGTASAGSLSMLLNKPLIPDEQYKTLSDSLLDTADEYINEEDHQGYGIPYKYDGPGFAAYSGELYDIVYHGFETDSNQRAVNNMLAMAYAYDLTGENKYLNGVAKGMDYIFGNNPLAFSYVTGCGSYHVKNPSHRYWLNELDPYLPQTPDGVLVSGPNAMPMDQYMRALGFNDNRTSADPSERYYADSVEAWSTNSTSLGCNASLAWLVSFMQDEASDTVDEPAATGDVNADGEFNVADVVLLQKWLLAAPNAKLTKWKAADFFKDNKLDVFDLTLMKKALVSQNTQDYIEPDERFEYGTPCTVDWDGLKLYKGPDESYEVITTIPNNAHLNEIGYQEGNNDWLFTEYKGQYGWIQTRINGHSTIYYAAVAKKPVIYLYPEEETDVHVELELTEADLSTTYPKYNNGWDVTASPDGTLLNKADGTHHKYLFWDATNCRTRFDFSKGFCIAGSDTESFLKEKLTYMGLTEEEMNEFIVYWLPLMEHNKYNLISFQGDAYTNSAKLNITPTPDSVLRVFMAYVPLEEAVETEPQQLEGFERKGFTVVEWGGSEIRS